MIFCFIWNEKKKIDQKDEKRNNERTKQFKDKQK